MARANVTSGSSFVPCADDASTPVRRESGPALQVRAMLAADLETVLRNEIRAYAFPWTNGMFAECLRDAQFDCRVGVLGREVVGHGILSAGAGEAHVLNVCVARRYQGYGHGSVMMAHLLERAWYRHAARTVFLEVRPSNQVAIGLYQGLGFAEVGRRKNYYPAAVGHEDALVMALDLVRYMQDAAPQSSL